MIKKILSCLLAVILAVAAPVCVFAEAEEELLETELRAPQIMRVPATKYPLQYIYPEYIKGEDCNRERITEYLGNARDCGIGIRTRTYKTNGSYDLKKGLEFTVIYEGYTASGITVKAEGADITREKSEGMLTDPTTGATYKFKETYRTTYIDPDISELNIGISCTPVQVNNRNTITRNIIVRFDDGRGEAPQNVSFKISDSDPDKYVLENADSSMEYRLKSGKEWTDCTDNTLLTYLRLQQVIM